MFELKDDFKVLSDDERFQLGEWLWIVYESLHSEQTKLISDILLGEMLLTLVKNDLTKWKHYIKVLQDNDWLTLVHGNTVLLGGMIVYVKDTLDEGYQVKDTLGATKTTMDELPDLYKDHDTAVSSLTSVSANALVDTFKRVVTTSKQVGNPFSRVVSYLSHYGSPRYSRSRVIDLVESIDDLNLTTIKLFASTPGILTDYVDTPVLGDISAREYSYVRLYVGRYILNVIDEHNDSAGRQLTLDTSEYARFIEWNKANSHYQVEDDVLKAVLADVTGNFQSADYWKKIVLWAYGINPLGEGSTDPKQPDVFTDPSKASVAMLEGLSTDLEHKLSAKEDQHQNTSDESDMLGDDLVSDDLDVDDPESLVVEADKLLAKTTDDRFGKTLFMLKDPLELYRYFMKLADKITVVRFNMINHLADVSLSEKDAYLDRINELAEVHTDLLSVAEDLVNPELD